MPVTLQQRERRLREKFPIHTGMMAFSAGETQKQSAQT
jgi:hypothetical protein